MDAIELAGALRSALAFQVSVSALTKQVADSVVMGAGRSKKSSRYVLSGDVMVLFDPSGRLVPLEGQSADACAKELNGSIARVTENIVGEIKAAVRKIVEKQDIQVAEAQRLQYWLSVQKSIQSINVYAGKDNKSDFISVKGEVTFRGEGASDFADRLATLLELAIKAERSAVVEALMSQIRFITA